MITEKLINECSTAIATLAKEISDTKHDSSWSIELPASSFLQQYPESELKDLVTWSKDVKNCKFIYMFSVNGGSTPEQLFELYKSARNREKENKGNRAFSRPIEPAPTLYVGSSNSIAGRIGQHLGHKNETVYSMRLRHWLMSDSIESLKIEVWRFPSQTSQPVLQAIEDFLWAQKKPMLGKQGGK